MFLAIRRWWFGGRGKITLRLFLFEFVVVVAGVIVAQAVSDWARERSEIAAMEQAKSRMDAEIAHGVATAQAWAIAIPCLDAQLVDIMVAAGDERPLDPRLFDRPTFRTEAISPMSTESGLLMVERYGADRAQLHFSLAQRAVRQSEISVSMAEKWLGLSVLNPDFGRVRDGDRVNARATASALRSALLSMGNSQSAFVSEARRLGIGPVDMPGRRRPRDCADIRTSGAIMPNA
ncbi:hypothetical protein [Sphingomonas mesophila]|uniref:hypothetical protein n=1 Tax=Sphingomonas mesophila TaxID=2303576 RepID=UPI000E56935D|nr:hypothetical protein [Sphingomonas mesophila]